MTAQIEVRFLSADRDGQIILDDSSVLNETKVLLKRDDHGRKAQKDKTLLALKMEEEAMSQNIHEAIRSQTGTFSPGCRKIVLAALRS